MSPGYDTVDLHAAAAVPARGYSFGQLLHCWPVPEEEREDKQEEEFD